MSVRYKSYSQGKLFPRPRAKYYTHSVAGRRPKRRTGIRSLRSYGFYGSSAVLQYGSTVVRSMEEESKVVRYKVVHFAPTRSTPGGSADVHVSRYGCINFLLANGARMGPIAPPMFFVGKL